jgi:uncharacterized membrane protein
MSDLPLHPVIVHFPIVLAVLLPLASLAALAYGLRVGAARKAWSAVAALHVLLVLSSVVAVWTGQGDEERVERVLASEAPLETHEEAGEFFLKAAGVALLATALGLAPGALGLAGRGLGSLGALGLLALGIQVGHSGGRLVYAHGAASAHVRTASAGDAEAAARAEGGSGRDDAAREREGGREGRGERDGDDDD